MLFLVLIDLFYDFFLQLVCVYPTSVVEISHPQISSVLTFDREKGEANPCFCVIAWNLNA